MKSRVRTASWRVIALSACLFVAGCNDQTLLEKLDQRQANDTISALQRRNIAARKVNQGKGGYAIVVAAEDFTGAVDTLNTLDLPPRPHVEVSQAFPGDTMVASPTAERVRLLSLIEQRLEQTLVTIDSVDRASVHLSYPIDDSNASLARPIHIAALIVHEPGIDEQELITKLKRFMRNAVSNANYDDISITLFPSTPPQLAPPSRAVAAHVGKSFWIATSLAGLGLLALLTLGIRRLFASLARRSTVARAAGGDPRFDTGAPPTVAQ
ncbi:Lipoprotein PrgK [Pararobbsia alpina]|uniref:type III secretion system inner membrane ring lipoprotein SctJ n=1 Tax=Pararobbsia alpina TaxID=621374 RepID=UPI0039A6C8EF